MSRGRPSSIAAIRAASGVERSVAILSNSRPELRERLRKFREEQTDVVMRDRIPGQPEGGIVRT